MKKYILLFFIFSITFGYTQNRKEIEITRFSNPPKIDGVINDIQWKGLILCHQKLPDQNQVLM